MHYKVTRRGVHDEKGEEIKIGTVIEAEPHKDGGHPSWLRNKVEQVDRGPVTIQQENTGGNTGDTGEGEARQALFKDAIGKLKSFEFTNDGRPDLRALNASLPEGSTPFTSDERDTLWPVVKDQVTVPTA